MDGSASASGSGRAAAPTLVLDRFRAMLRDREEKLRLAGAVAADGHVPPPSAAEVVRMYAELLGSLSVNSKPVITELTIIADENRHAAAGIVEAVCDRIRHAPEDKKLPSLYLLDSIVKNIRHEYVRYFANRLPEVFCEAYNQVHPSLYPAMQHLFGTWSIVFPTSVLRQIEKELHFSTSGSQQPPSFASVGRSESSSPRPSHGIHINPKYLEARRQLGNSAADIQHARGVPSSLQLYGQKSPVNYNEYEVNRRDIFPSQLELASGGSPRLAAGQMSSVVRGEDQLLHPKGKVIRSLSPLRTGLRRSASPSGDMFRRHLSPASVVERPSPSLSENEFRSSRVGHRNRWLERSWPSVDGVQQRENSTVYDRNKQRTRELIDAYGSYKDVSYYESLPKTQKFDVDGTKSEAAARKWKISEEDEYAWEDMSPTLADRSRGNNSPFTYDAPRLSTTVGLARPNTGILESDLTRFGRPSHVQLHPVDDPAISVEERTRLLPSDHESLNKKYLDDTGYQTLSFPPYRASHYAQDHWKLPHLAPPSSYPSLNPESRGRGHQMPFMENRIPSFGLPFDNASDGEVPYSRLPSACSESLNVATETVGKHLAQRTQSPPGHPVVWPPVQRSLPLPPNPIYSHLKQLHNPLDFADANKSTVYHGANSSSYLSQKQFDFIDRRPSSLNKMHHSPDHQSGLIHLNQQSREHGDIMGIRSQEVHGNLVSCAPAQVSSHVPPAQLLNPIQTQEQGPVPVPVFSNPSTDVLRQTHRGSLPPLPPGPPPAASQVGPSSESKSVITSATPASVFSGLISSLMEKGLISLTAPAPPQDSLGVEFNSDLLKVRHESAINGLYGDLPRKCTTCGLRFRLQEEHSNHMDWHVTKNRISKNRKQKPSRKWFVNAKEWLSGAETLGTDFVPGFIPTEEVTEKKEGKELAVPADENQNACALCGEPFEDFYSDETEEWMYKGAVYLNAPDGSIEGLERFQVGPIVHAVCRSESNKGLGEG